MKYDIAVIGGGPAGMMAAGRAGELGAQVLLLEKNLRPGLKLLMTGNGRCNITNQIETSRLLVEKYGSSGKFLFSAFSEFGPNEVIEFLESRGVATKVEAGGRVFPQSDKAQDVLEALFNYLKESKVKIKTGAEVKDIVKKGQKIEKIILTNGEEILADKFIIATGGKSYPASGSTGDGYKWLKKLGHEIVMPAPALTPIVVKEKFVKKIEGLSLKDVKISLLEIADSKNKKPIDFQIGDVMFTADGVSGPAILNLSRVVARALPAKLRLSLDLFPALSLEKLDQKIRLDFEVAKNKSIIGFLEKSWPRRLAETIVELIGIDPQKAVNSITKDERQKLVELFKDFSLSVYGLAGFDKAMITAGGVKLSEVDPKTMKSKMIDNLYLAGEILDIDGPTGGFNLQVCWSTGYRAGQSAAQA
jgi:predicted Rossmann fold flavoprotein